MIYKEGQKLTVIKSGSMGSTSRREVKICGEHNGEPIVQEYKRETNRCSIKKFYLFSNPSEKNETLIFNGWNLPVDANVNEGVGEFVLCGGGINLIFRDAPLSVEALQDYIADNNINELFDDFKHLELHHGGRTYARLYPKLQDK